MKIKAYCAVKPVFIQQGEFTNRDTKEVIKYYQAVCVCDNECDKIGVKSDIVPELEKHIGSDVLVWIEVDTNGNKPKIVSVGEKVKEKTAKE